MTDSFYMVLPSNASLQTFPGNRPGLYRIRLPERLRLQGHWKVGLVNLIFPSTFAPPNMDPLAAMVSMGNTETDPFNIIDATNIKTVGELMDATVVTLSTMAVWRYKVDLSNHIVIRETNSKIEIQTFRGSTLGFNAYLARKLGLLTDNGSIPVDYYDAVSYRDNFVYILPESVVRLNVGREDPLSVAHSLKEHVLNLYVYADIVEPHPVGDTRKPIFSTVFNTSSSSSDRQKTTQKKKKNSGDHPWFHNQFRSITRGTHSQHTHHPQTRSIATTFSR